MASPVWLLTTPLWLIAVGLLWLAGEVRLLRCGQVQPGFWMLLRESLDTLALRSTQARQLAQREHARQRTKVARFLD